MTEKRAHVDQMNKISYLHLDLCNLTKTKLAFFLSAYWKLRPDLTEDSSWKQYICGKKMQQL